MRYSHIIYLSFLTFFIFLIILIPSHCECEINRPFIKNEKCQSDPCTQNELNQGICLINNSIIKTQWLNNIVILNERKYRYGSFAINSEGDMFIEYSMDNSRLFYGLKKNGKYYFKDEENKETPIKHYLVINNDNPSEIVKQYESKKIFISLKSDTYNSKEYFFGVSADLGYAELFDFDSEHYSIMKTEQLLGFKIFSYSYFLLNLNNTEKEYVCGFTRTLENEGDSITLTKISFSENYLVGNEKIKDQTLRYNMKNRIVSSFIKEERIYLFYLNSDKKYIVNIYDYVLNQRNNETIVIYDKEMGNINEGKGLFFTFINLRDNITIFIYYTGLEENYPQLKVGNLVYTLNNRNIYYYYFEEIIFKIIDEYKFQSDILKNDLIKIHNKRFSFISSSSDNSTLYILLFDLYNHYKNMKTRVYKINIYNYYNYKLAYEFSSILFNNNLVFSSTAFSDSINDYFSILILFGFVNGTDNIIDISSYFIEDDNFIYNDNNIIIKLKDNIIIDNNIFGYEIADKIKLINIPQEIIFYNIESNENKIQLSNDDILNINYILIQNENLEKNNEYYIMEYQSIIKEPDYEIFNTYPIKIIDTRNDDNIDQEDEFEPVEFYGRINKVQFKLCYKYCSTCYYYGTSIDDQKCNTCLVNYDYYNENSTNCIPEGYFRDKELGKIIECNNNNSKFYFEKETNKSICFKNDLDCPIEYLYYLPNKRQCKFNCSYSELLNKTCIIWQKNNIIYDELVKDIIKDYQNNGDTLVIETKDNFAFQLTNSKNELNTIEGINSNEYNLSLINLTQCENLLKNKNYIDKDTPLILLKYEKLTNITNQKYVQYEVYNPYTLEKMNLSICQDIPIEIYTPINLDENTKNLYNDLQQSGYDLFNSNDPFYHDICTPYRSLYDTDVIIPDRRKDYFNYNITTCQEGCEYSKYLIESNLLKCECSIKNENIQTEIRKEDFEVNNIFTSFYEVIKYSNLKVLKCYKLVFSSKGQKKNIGSLLLIIFFAFYLSLTLFHIVRRIKPLEAHISRITFIRNNKQRKAYTKKSFQTSFLDLYHNNGKCMPPKKENKSKNISNNFNNNNIKIINININNKEDKSKSDINTLMGNKKKSLIVYKKENINKINNNLKRKRTSKIYNNKKIGKTKKRPTTINLKNLNFINEKEVLSDFQLNNLEYSDAIKLDKRSFCRIYTSIIRRQHLILFTFFSCNDYNLLEIKLIKFIFMISLDMVFNIIFFVDDSMHKVYINYGKYNFIQQFPQTLYSTIVSEVLDVFLCYLSLTDKIFYKIKKHKNSKNIKLLIEKTLKCVRIKLIVFLSLTFIVMLFFWYFISSFCAVYKNTQNIFLKDCLSSFLTSLIYPFLFYLLSTLLRIISLRYHKKRLKFLFKLSDIIPIF